ncbi:flagellin [Ferrovibrio sp.]|uniref:flagellin n=1 Tax=Ferrovibrio sp. TaxID=1917215 RepID=UPI00311F656B
MVAVTGTTQLAQQFTFTRNIRQLNLQLARQNEQLGSGRYADGLIGVSQRALELSQLKADLGSVNNYKSGVQTAQNRVGLYAVGIEKIIDLATEAKDLMIKTRDPFFAATAAPRVQIETLMDQVGSLLQTKDGERFLFGGTDYTITPINGQLSQLATTYAANAVPGAAGYPVPFAAAANAGAYPPAPYAAAANFYLGTTGTLANTFNYQGVTLYSDDNELVSYGVSAAEPAFQQLVDAMIRFRDATQDIAGNGPNYTVRVDDARAQLETAITSLKTIASRNGYKQQQLKEVQERHDRSLDVLKVRIGAIENVDIGEVSVNIKNLQTSLEASYVITRDSLQLSLVNFLR